MIGTTVVREEGALVVELTKAAFKALEREARAQMDSAIDDLGSDDGDRERVRLNACADVLSAIQCSRRGWGLEDPREEDLVRAVRFSAEVVAFLRKLREQAAGHVSELDTSGEGDLDYNAREVYWCMCLTGFSARRWLPNGDPRS